MVRGMFWSYFKLNKSDLFIFFIFSNSKSLPNMWMCHTLGKPSPFLCCGSRFPWLVFARICLYTKFTFKEWCEICHWFAGNGLSSSFWMSAYDFHQAVSWISTSFVDNLSLLTFTKWVLKPIRSFFTTSTRSSICIEKRLSS